MIRSLFTATTGMDAQEVKIDAVANNLANVSTTGFKKSRTDFQDLIYQQVRSPGSISAAGNQVPSGIQIGQGVRTSSVSKIFTQGDFIQTGNALDICIEGDGFFQITMPDGTTAYTRDGSYKLDSTGNIVTSEGYLLIPQMTVPADTVTINIGSDGTVTVEQGGQTAITELGNIQLTRFTNPSGLKAVGRNLLTETDASGAPIVSNPGLNGAGTLAQGFLENSNVNIAEEMVNMIIAQRAYEAVSKVIRTADSMLDTVNRIK